ncbi:MAG: DUF2934 domain-containing protein [Steroidobacteraceae bacterium]|jgi:DUF2934 family protein
MPRETIKARKPAKAPVVEAKVAAAATREQTSASRPAMRSAPLDAGRRRALIAEAAYYRSLRQGGSEVEHWLAAEQEVDAQLMKPGRS